MKKPIWSLLLTLPIFLGILLFIDSKKTIANEKETVSSIHLKIASSKEITQIVAQNTLETKESAITSVSQLSDIQPSDWAFQALQSLVERYGCIVGYPDSQYRGNRPLTRYEFAAGLSACLDQVTKLIASSTANIATKEDLATLERLTEEFRPEIAQLRGRLDSLEARAAEIEANQFSTTTKLTGEVIFLAADTFGDRANNTPANDTKDDTNTFLSYQARLNLQTSFTGKDQLITTLTANNIPVLASSTGTHMTRFSVDKSGPYADGSLYIASLFYRFPVGKNATVWIGPRTVNFPATTPTLNALNGNPAQGGISRFGQFNPTVYRPGFDGAGAAVAYKFNNKLQLNLSYIADNFQANQPDKGLFNDSSQAALAQLTFSPSKQFDLGLTYTRKYFPTNSGNNLTGGTGSSFARDPFRLNSTTVYATTSDNFGLQFNWKTSSKFHLGGWFGYTLAHQEVGGNNDATIINGALTLSFPDLFKQGNVGGITVGVPPKVTSNSFQVAGQKREDKDTSLHIETFYRFRVNDNISVTPIFYLITTPEHNATNDLIWVGALRTTFNF
ncbi:iron uptake porin [Anabaena sp. WFMT]|uniref:iron uptake porin n=1 Tax=Anabaena sp. WFMT TaxID=3449730 RepID=UPI003F25A89D